MDVAIKKPATTKKKRSPAKIFRFGFLIHDVSRTRRTMMDHYMRPLGITRSQWSVISALSRGGDEGLMQVDLARLLEVGKVTVGGLIDRLEATGHVERRADPSGDRRVKRVFITHQGYEMLDRMKKVSEDLNNRILSGISAEDIAKCEDVLMRVKANIKEAIRVAPAAVPRGSYRSGD
jgi:MarR family transcriptional regulator for hemolysin